MRQQQRSDDMDDDLLVLGRTFRPHGGRMLTEERDLLWDSSEDGHDEPANLTRDKVSNSTAIGQCLSRSSTSPDGLTADPSRESNLGGKKFRTKSEYVYKRPSYVDFFDLSWANAVPVDSQGRPINANLGSLRELSSKLMNQTDESVQSADQHAQHSIPGSLISISAHGSPVDFRPSYLPRNFNFT